MRGAGDAGDTLRVRPVEPVRNPQHPREGAHQAAVGPLEPGERRVPLPGKCLAMVARHARDNFELALRETLQVAIENQVIGALVVLRVIDHVADVVQQRRRFQQLARIGRQPEPLRHPIEELRRQTGDLLAMPLARPALPRERTG